MHQATERVYEALLRKEIKCRIRETDKTSLVEVTFNGKTFPTATFFFISNSEGNDVAIRAVNVVKFPQERLGKLLEACNDVNRRYRFVKFVVDAKNSAVNIEMDIPSRCEDVGEVAGELLVRAVSVLDAIYPQLMQAAWA